MLNVFYLTAIIIGISGQNVAQKPYTQKTGGRGAYFFSALVSFSALLFFVFTTSKLDFALSFLPYAVGFAVSYALAMVCLVLSVAYGSLSLTSLFVSYSLMIPTLYGLLSGESISIGFIPGILLLLVSLFLTNKTDKQDKKAKISFKWIVCVTLTFIGNGTCTVIQKMQQVASNGGYKNEFMIVSLAMVTAVLLVMSLVKERGEMAYFAKSGWLLAIICGGLNGMVNLFVMVLSARMSVSVMFPLISAGGLVVTYLISRFVYKEILTKSQLVGFVCGLAAVVLLNI